LPDIFSLTEWSDWLTPTDLHEQGRRRFDTIFYSAHLPEKPETILDEAEISSVEWTSPSSILQQCYARELWLAPPQVYELCRLLNFRSAERLAEFCMSRHKQGCVSWLPVRLQCDDGLISLLPGDSLYPKVPDLLGNPETKSLSLFKGSLKDCGDISSSLNRIEFKDTYECHPRVNISPANGHVNPLDFQEFVAEHDLTDGGLLHHHDCKACPEEQQRFCHKQSQGSWTGDFNEKDLEKGRNQEKKSSFDDANKNIKP